MGTIHLLIANASEYFTEADISMMHSAAKSAETYISGAYPFDYNVDIIIAPPSFMINTIPEDGISGRTYGSRLIAMAIDVQQADIREDIIFETICHEMAHSLRWEKLPEYSKTMLDAIIFEGLAITVEEKAMKDCGRQRQQFFLTEMQNTSQAAIDAIIAELKPSFEHEDYDYESIFFTGNERLPRWAGYKLGYHLVKTIMKQTNVSPEELAIMSYKDLRTFSSKIVL